MRCTRDGASRPRAAAGPGRGRRRGWPGRGALPRRTRAASASRPATGRLGHEPAGGVPDLVLGPTGTAPSGAHPQQRLPRRLRPAVHPPDCPGQRRGAPPPSRRRGEQGLPGGAAGLQGGVTEHHQVEQGEVPGAGEQRLLDRGHGQPAPGRPGHRAGVPDDGDLGPLGTGLRLGHADDHRQAVGQRRQPQVVQAGRGEVGQHARGRQYLRPGHEVAPGRREVGLPAVEAEPDAVPPGPTYPSHDHVPLCSHPGRLPVGRGAADGPYARSVG